MSAIEELIKELDARIDKTIQKRNEIQDRINLLQSIRYDAECFMERERKEPETK